MLMGWENCFLPSSHGEWLANDSKTQKANSWIQSLHLADPRNVVVDAPDTLSTSKESYSRLRDRHLALTELGGYQGIRHIIHQINKQLN